jgi:hypothetical protein
MSRHYIGVMERPPFPECIKPTSDKMYIRPTRPSMWAEREVMARTLKPQQRRRTSLQNYTGTFILQLFKYFSLVNATENQWVVLWKIHPGEHFLCTPDVPIFNRHFQNKGNKLRKTLISGGQTRDFLSTDSPADGPAISTERQQRYIHS